MRHAIKFVLCFLAFQPQLVAAKASPVKATLKECMLWLGLDEEPYKVKFEYVFRAAKSLKFEVQRQVDPAKDHIEGFVALAHQINLAVAKTAESYVDENLAKALMTIYAETQERIGNGRVTYEYMTLLPVRIGLVQKGRGAFDGRNPLNHDSYLLGLRSGAGNDESDRQVLKALERFPSQLLIPFMGYRITKSEREQLLGLKVWPIEMARNATAVGGLKVDPYALAIDDISQANHLSGFGQPKFWTALMPPLFDSVRRAEVDNFLELGALQPFHQRLFARDAASLFILQRGCPTLECLAGRLHQTGDLKQMTRDLEGLLTRGVAETEVSRARRLAKIYLRAFESAILAFSRAALAEEKVSE